MTVTVVRTSILHRTGRFPFSNHYDCTVNGTRYTNSSLPELRSVLLRKEGVRKADITVIDNRCREHKEMSR